MTGITGGTVHVLQRKKTGDYEHREVKAELSFGVSDGDEHNDVLSRVVALTDAVVNGLLHGLPAKTAEPALTNGGDAPKTRTRSRPPAAVEPDPLAAPPAAPVAPDPAPTTSADVGVIADDDPLGVGVKTEEPDPLAGPSAGAGPATASPSEATTDAAGMDGLTADEGLTAARDVTDKELNDACAHANARLIQVHKEKGTAMLRALLAKFVKPGQTARNIPAELRQKFLDELGALK